MKPPLGFVIYSYLPILIGALLGAALGYFGQCSSGACPLTSTWWRGAIYGAVLGTLFFLSSSGTNAKTSKNDRPDVREDQSARVER